MPTVGPSTKPTFNPSSDPTTPHTYGPSKQPIYVQPEISLGGLVWEKDIRLGVYEYKPKVISSTDDFEIQIRIHNSPLWKAITVHWGLYETTQVSGDVNEKYNSTTDTLKANGAVEFFVNRRRTYTNEEVKLLKLGSILDYMTPSASSVQYFKF
eukprot:UN31017